MTDTYLVTASGTYEQWRALKSFPDETEAVEYAHRWFGDPAQKRSFCRMVVRTGTRVVLEIRGTA